MAGQRYWAVIPAAGIGRRMGAQRPKQYLEVAGTMVLEHTLARFCDCTKIQGVVVGLTEQDQYWSQCRYASHSKIYTIKGGAERYHTVVNALDFLLETAAIDDWVLVHDAARPCVQPNDINRLIAATVDYSAGAILASPVSDTLKQVDDKNNIQKTVSRIGLWRAFTPQIFRLGMLRKALQYAMDQGINVTDEAEAMEYYGKIIGVILGRSDNIKITHPEDLNQVAWQLQKNE